MGADEGRMGPESIALPPSPPVASIPGAGAAVASAAMSTALNQRLAPQDVEAERSVLGGVLLTNESLYDVLEIVQPEDFYRETHRKVFIAMQDMAMRNDPIDVITLGDVLLRRGELESVGGPMYLASLDASVPASSNLVRYAEIVRDKAHSRRLIEAGHTIARTGYEQLGTVEEQTEAALVAVHTVTDRVIKGEARSLSKLVPERYTAIKQRYDGTNKERGIPTGFKFLDEMTGGIKRREMTIIAGRPSMGKTALAMKIAAFTGVEMGLPVQVFSLEMSSEALTDRLMCSEARVDSRRFASGQLEDNEWDRLAKASERIHEAPITIDDSGGQTILSIRAKARKQKSKSGLGLIVIDYLQLMHGTKQKRGGFENREQEIAGISRGLKELAKELDVPVIALCQLSRDLERREDKRPKMSDLRESGSLEQDVDLCVFVYRDEMYFPKSEDKGIAELIVGKQRNGPTGVVRVAFTANCTRFDELSDNNGGGADGGWG